MEELQRNSSVNHGLVTEQDVEQKSKELRILGETLTELKSKCCYDLPDVFGDHFDYCGFSGVSFVRQSICSPLICSHFVAFLVCLSAFTLELQQI